MEEDKYQHDPGLYRYAEQKYDRLGRDIPLALKLCQLVKRVRIAKMLEYVV